MNIQRTLMAAATTAVGFAFGLWVYNNYFQGKAMVSRGGATAAAPSMPIPTASSSANDGL